MYKNRSQGFTLIELLVVIAIIGILSAVVLASLNTARSKGQDAAIQSDASAIATQAEIFYGDNSNTYGPDGVVACNTAGSLWLETNIAKAITAAVTASGGSGVTDVSRAACASSKTKYNIALKMVAYSGYWCVDSGGTSKAVSGTIPTAAALVTAGYVCP